MNQNHATITLPLCKPCGGANPCCSLPPGHLPRHVPGPDMAVHVTSTFTRLGMSGPSPMHESCAVDSGAR